jgi:hypothetical protein
VTEENKGELQRARQLTFQKINGEISEQGIGELSKLLARSKAARAEYWQLIAIHAQLEWELGSKADDDTELAWQGADQAASNSFFHTTLGKLPAFRVSPSLVMAASLLAILLGTVWMWPGDGSLQQIPVASSVVEQAGPDVRPAGTIVALQPDSKWLFGPGQTNSGTFGPGETIWLETGSAEIRFVNGVIAKLESPLVMQVISEDRVRLSKGILKVEVPENAIGFSVETESAEVVDLGTVFSVNVSRSDTDVVVFDGQVDLKLAALHLPPDSESVKRLYGGEAVKVHTNGTLSRIVEVRQPTANQPNTADPRVIAAVRDNNHRENFWSFYEIVPGGMGEDAAAFVDRHHQWNGMTQQGMPSYLIGGDYVKTFNDDKVADDLKVEVVLEQPATCYVLLDVRVKPPAWLLESFEDTGDKVGVDEETYTPEGAAPPKDGAIWELAVGAGESIDMSHSVWRRVMPEGGTIFLETNGPLLSGETDGIRSGANMYGFVAVPLN